MTELNENTKQKDIVSPEGKEVVEMFQRAIGEAGVEKHKEMVREFYNGLISLITPPNSSNPNYTDQQLNEIIIQGNNGFTGGLCLGAGTSGQRIIFRNYDRETFQETKDKLSGWMIYPKPKTHGMDFWINYMKHFGKEEVDLRQKL